MTPDHAYQTTLNGNANPLWVGTASTATLPWAGSQALSSRSRLRPFFTYFGGKWRVSPRYPRPQHAAIIEPFAGSAGYSLRYPHHQVGLYDIDPVICGVWDYLIHVSPQEVMSLPLVFDHVDEIDAAQEAKWLIGFWCNKGCSRPSKSPSKWMRDYESRQPGTYWGEKIRARIASQLGHIRHWTICQSSYADMPDQEAVWFIDPPYEVAGKAYKFHEIDYPALGEWCRSRSGQVIVCENEGADWLPFVPFRTIKALEGKRGGKRSKEALWTRTVDQAWPAADVAHDTTATYAQFNTQVARTEINVEAR
jgi:hypothetical protein